MKRTIYFRCTENDVEHDYDGGRVLLGAVQAQETNELAGGNLVLVFNHDEPMREFPVSRADKQGKYYRVTVEEVTEADLPPDPTLPKPPSAFDMLVAARDAATREGNEELAASLTRQLSDGVA